MKIMVFGVYLRKYCKFQKIFLENIVALIKIHILFLINFSIALIVFEKFDDKVYDMKHCRLLDGFFKHDGENLTLLPLLQYLELSPYLRISRRWFHISRKSDVYCTEMYYTSSNVSLIFLETLNCRKKCMWQKICISMKSTNYIQNIFRNFAYWLR